jgi:hypothetical protein
MGGEQEASGAANGTGCPNNAGHPAIAPGGRCRYTYALHQLEEIPWEIAPL